MEQHTTFANVIVADADHIDRVAFDLTVNFERMLGRRIPPADMGRWAECVALDGGLRAATAGAPAQQTLVVLVHEPGSTALRNFTPSVYATELDGQGFTGPLGEFTFSAVSGEGLVPKADLLADTLTTVAAMPGLRRLMVVPADDALRRTAALLDRLDPPDARVTLFAMQPLPTAPCRQEILGYSLLKALGIEASEIHPDQ